MTDIYRKRRAIIFSILTIFISGLVFINIPNQTKTSSNAESAKVLGVTTLAIKSLDGLQIKDKAPNIDYSRDKFGAGWKKISGCDTRNIILNRDLTDVTIDDNCNVLSGTLNDPYTGKIIQFKRGSGTSSMIQIDHVVSLSNAWQTGAQLMTLPKRIELANDPLELLAVDGSANQQKSDGDAENWLPTNKSFRCQYVARQIAVKIKYLLWVTKPEHDAIQNVLIKCPNQMLPSA